MRSAGWFLWLLALAVGAGPGWAGGAECGDNVRCRCGDVLSGAYRLDAGLGPCPANGLVLRGGAVLDCQGKTVKGTDQGTSVGIVLDGTVDAVVSNCVVTGFRSGIEFRRAQRSTVLQSTVVNNGDVRRRAGYGIHFNRSLQNTVRDCAVGKSADEGIHVGSGSHDNEIIGNRLYENGRENLYVLDARGTRILRNQFRGNVSAALYMKHATGSRVEANQFDDRPVVVLGRSSGNVFADNRFSAGLKFQAFTGEGKTTAPAGNVVRKGWLSGGETCLTFVEATDNRIETVAIEDCRRIASYSQHATTNHFIGVSLEQVPLDLAGGATFRLLELVRVKVLGARGKPLAGVLLDLRDRTGDHLEEPATDGTGSAELVVPRHVVNAVSLVALTPVELRLRHDGYATLTTTLTDPLPPHLNLALEPSR